MNKIFGVNLILFMLKLSASKGLYALAILDIGVTKL